MAVELQLGLFAAPLVSLAQPPTKVFRIGILAGLPASPEAARLWEGITPSKVCGEFLVTSRGRTSSSSSSVDYYEGSVDRLSRLGRATWFGSSSNVIVTAASPAPEVAKRATSTIPIGNGPTHIDPVGSGLVVSLARPRGNVTGTSLLSAELRGKQLQLLKEALPDP